jgi:hypothetical protein
MAKGVLVADNPTLTRCLLTQVRTGYVEYNYAALTLTVLAHLTTQHGVDFATALWYHRLRRAEPHRAFIEAVEARLQNRRMYR